MRYWEACEALATVKEAIEECRLHDVKAEVRDDDAALVQTETGDIIAEADECSDYNGGDILGFLG